MTLDVIKMQTHVIESVHKNTDGTVERKKTTRGTHKGMEQYLEILKKDDTVVSYDVTISLDEDIFLKKTC